MKKLVLSVITAAVATSVQAQTENESEPVRDMWQFELGVGAASYQSLYQGLDRVSGAMPILGASYNEFFLDGATLGYEFYQAEDSTAFLSIGLDDPFDGERSDSSVAAVKALGDVDSGTNVSLGIERFTPFGLLSAQLGGDISGEHSGSSINLEWAVPLEYDELMIMPSVEFSWASAELVNHYYGVSASQAAKSGLASYDAGSASALSFAINAEYQLSEQWSMMGGISYTKYSSAIADSPLTDRDDSSSVFFGTVYRF